HDVVARAVDLLSPDDVLLSFQRPALEQVRALRPTLRTVQRVEHARDASRHRRGDRRRSRPARLHGERRTPDAGTRGCRRRRHFHGRAGSSTPRLLGRLGSSSMNPFEDDGVWLKCALHAHTTNSDGELAPPLLVHHYEWAGYDVLAITDHWVRTVERSTPKLLVIASAELNALAGGHDAHVLALGVDTDLDRPDTAASLAEVVHWIADHGGVPFLAHTYWSGLRTGAWERCEGLVGIEVW